MNKMTPYSYERHMVIEHLRVNKQLYPTYESLPNGMKKYFTPFEGGYVEIEAYELMERVGKENLPIIQERARKFEVIHRMVQAISEKIINEKPSYDTFAA